MPKIASNAVFKSKQPRIGFHHDLEKKIRDTHTNMNEGLDSYSRDQYSTIQQESSAGKRIKVKINDDIMNADDLGRQKQNYDAITNSTIPGSLKRGNAFHTQSSGFNSTKYPVNLPKVPRSN
jgi:hypothetical protein